jgi:thioesterase domain-containing protein
MCLGSAFARMLGPEQPLYAINANGVDGRQPPANDMRSMVMAYVEEIRRASPTGALRVGAMCTGCLAAIEIARELQREGRETGPVILADPPPVPPASNRNHKVNNVDPRAAHQLYQQAQRALLDHAARPYNDMPFDAQDPKQLHAATLAGVSSLMTFSSHNPRPFPGPAALIISAERAPGFFHPQMPWHKLLPGPRIVHVLPWNHQELFRSGRETVARLLKFLLEQDPNLLVCRETTEASNSRVIVSAG